MVELGYVTVCLLSLILIPLKVLHIGNIFTVAFSLGCAFAPNAPTLVAFRFLCMLVAFKGSFYRLTLIQRGFLEAPQLLAVLDQSATALHLVIVHQQWRYILLVLSLVRFRCQYRSISHQPDDK